MAERTPESGYEFVLDNRKLILAFVVLIAMCGCFFVLGFIWGKRQGDQERAQGLTDSSAISSLEGSQASASEPADVSPGTPAPRDSSDEQQLQWYKNVNRRESTPGIEPQTGVSTPTRKIVQPEPSAEPAGKIAPQASSPRSGRVTYSVQVGAFLQLRELEMQAQTLRSKGFDYRIEAPQSPGQFYLLKVGKFNSRAEAVGMQHRLKDSGFTSAFIKTN